MEEQAMQLITTAMDALAQLQELIGGAAAGPQGQGQAPVDLNAILAGGGAPQGGPSGGPENA